MRLRQNLSYSKRHAVNTIQNHFLAARQSKTVAFLLALEFFLLVTLLAGLAIYQDPNLNLVPSPLNKILFFSDISLLLLVLVVTVYLIYQRQNIRQTVQAKTRAARKEPRITALLLVEFFLTLVLVLAAFIYLDKDYNVVPWPWNVAVFLVILGIVSYLYLFSAKFRHDYYGFFNIK